MNIQSFPVGAFLIAALCLASCGGPSKVDYARPFPPTLKQSETVDVQVLRRETELTLTNTSAEAFEAGTLWINRQYSMPLDSMAVGETLTLPLASFRNEYSEAFRGGGFFATEKPDKIAQVQLEIGDRLVGFVIVGDR